VEQHVVEDQWDKLCSDYFAQKKRYEAYQQKELFSSTTIKRVERNRSVKNGRE
jgi:hypothetical protein